MKHQVISVLSGALFAGAVLLGAAVMADAQAPLDSQAEQQWVHRMEQHWLKLVREPDPEQRKILIREHRLLMEEVARMTGARPGAQTGMGSAGNREGMGTGRPHQPDLINTIDMHSMMLDMLK